MKIGEKYNYDDNVRKSVMDFNIFFDNIKQMYVCSRHCLNEVSENAILAGMAAEAELLSYKILCMLERWNDFLPLREYDRKEWDRWTGIVDNILESMDDYPDLDGDKQFPFHIPSHEFLFDLYRSYKRDLGLDKDDPGSTKDSQTAPGSQFTKTNIQYIGGLIEELKKEYAPDWFDVSCRSSCLRLIKRMNEIPLTSHFINEDEQQFQKRVNGFFATLQSTEEMLICCRLCLRNLSKVLKSADCIFNQDISSTTFEQLTVRQKYHLCMPTLLDQQRAVRGWKNLWSKRAYKKNAEKKKEESIQHLQKLSDDLGLELAEYIDLQKPQTDGNDQFGRFLFNNSSKLNREHIRAIYAECDLINRMNEILDEEKPTCNPSSARVLKPEERTIWDDIQEFIKRGKNRWNKVNVEDVTSIMAAILQIHKPLPNKDLCTMSENLWSQFKKRRQSGPNKSCRMTWLYVVGVFLDMDLITGGSSDLCDNIFFPGNKEKQEDDPIDCRIDYNCIGKGKNRETKSFNDVIELICHCTITYCKEHGIHLERQG